MSVSVSRESEGELQVPLKCILFIIDIHSEVVRGEANLDDHLKQIVIIFSLRIALVYMKGKTTLKTKYCFFLVCHCAVKEI